MGWVGVGVERQRNETEEETNEYTDRGLTEEREGGTK